MYCTEVQRLSVVTALARAPDNDNMKEELEARNANTLLN